jgi:hypothetical protein
VLLAFDAASLEADVAVGVLLTLLIVDAGYAGPLRDVTDAPVLALRRARAAGAAATNREIAVEIRLAMIVRGTLSAGVVEERGAVLLGRALVIAGAKDARAGAGAVGAVERAAVVSASTAAKSEAATAAAGTPATVARRAAAEAAVACATRGAARAADAARAA